jgi:hypothetical protein
VVALKRDGQTGFDSRTGGSRNAVVALKRGGVQRIDRDGNRSRNAVVALKPGRRPPGGRSGAAKQERCGGIETFSLRLVTGLIGSEAGTPWWH